MTTNSELPPVLGGGGCGCGGGAAPVCPTTAAWRVGTVDTPAGALPQIATRLTFADQLGALRVRCNIGRMNYRVPPGLYAVGTPTPDAPVLVTANYKLTFDRVRQELGGQNLWLLVLDTAGVNVWCAAGKGTFGTPELVRRIAAVRLPEIVRHRTLILPQLGAPGVAAHEVLKHSGFRVVYGPVYARDLPAFLAAGQQATPAMRRVRFTLAERLAVVPVELTIWFKWLVLLVTVLYLASGLLGGNWGRCGGIAALALAAYLTGGVGVAALLPWLPGRAFAIKGALAGLLLMAGLHLSGALTAGCGVRTGVEAAAWWLLAPAIASFLAMNYTGTTTFTSQSGVKKELRYAIPAQAAALVLGLALFMLAQWSAVTG
ncbi:MAG: mercury methylation corrinoid protein HgcA [Lentisphaeria bacterium]